MANRSTRFQLKHNSTITGSTLPSSGILVAEPLVNLYDGIMYFSGTPGSTGYTTGNTNVGYFEVGSHLTNLRLDGLITSYSGVSGSGLENKILSGTSQGFVLVDSSNINGISAFTYTASANTFTIYDSNGTPYSATVTSVSGLTINGDFTITGNTTLQSVTASTLNVTGNTILQSTTASTLNVTGNTTLQSFTGGSGTINGDLNVTGNTILQSTTASTLNVTGNTILESTTASTLNVTGNTILQSTTASTLNVTGNTSLQSTTASTLNVTGNTNLNSLTASTTNINGNLTVTGSTTTNSISAATYNTNLGANLVVYTNGLGTLSTETGFSYDSTGDTLSVKNAIIGSGGSIFSAGTGDLVVHGNLTVFGESISAFTSSLYIEDNNIVLNFNPTGSTADSSVNSGFEIRDGSGISGSSVNLDIVRLQYLLIEVGLLN